MLKKDIKSKGMKLGADLFGIASAEVLDVNPPDPAWPQTPNRLWSDSKSVVVLAKRIPLGLLLAEDTDVKMYAPHIVMHKLDEIALELSYYLESNGYYAFPLPTQITDLRLKRGSYGFLSLRHVALEAGLGTLGLNVSLITPEYGPRIYLSAVMTNAEIKPDERIEKQLCPGASCGRCLLACPADAIGHFRLNKRLCSKYAQVYGAHKLLEHVETIIDAKSEEERKNQVRDLTTVGIWQALKTGAGAYAACFKCMEVCPVGRDFVHLKRKYGIIPNSKKEKIRRLKAMQLAENRGENAKV